MTGRVASWSRALLLVPLLGLLAGCPSERPGAGAAPLLNLSASPGGQVELQARPGDRIALQLTCGPEAEAPLFGALIGGVDSSSMTQWHADPEGAVTFDPAGLALVPERPGAVTVWATWKTPEGVELRSNDLRLQVKAAE